MRKDVQPEIFQQTDMFARAATKIILHRNCVDAWRSLCETMSVSHRQLIKGTNVYTIFS
jgi:hypothetical protein